MKKKWDSNSQAHLKVIMVQENLEYKCDKEFKYELYGIRLTIFKILTIM